eukprot:10896844-Alexandrium_andersonii.AAC.1
MVKAPRRPQHLPLNLRRGAFCAAFRAESESANETGRRARGRRFSGGVRRAEPPGGRLMIIP